MVSLFFVGDMEGSEVGEVGKAVGKEEGEDVARSVRRGVSWRKGRISCWCRRGRERGGVGRVFSVVLSGRERRRLRRW